MTLCGDVGEDAGRRLAVGEIAVVPERARAEVHDLTRPFASLLNHDERFRIGHRYGTQDERFEGAQHYGRGAKAARENRDDAQAEEGRLLGGAPGTARVRPD